MRRNGNLRITDVTPAEWEAIFRRAARMVSVLQGAIHCGEITTELFDHVERALAAVPLSSEQFSLARCRCLNAQAYCEMKEFKAARYELRLVYQSLTWQLMPGPQTENGVVRFVPQATPALDRPALGEPPILCSTLATTSNPNSLLENFNRYASIARVFCELLVEKTTSVVLLWRLLSDSGQKVLP